jgi:hypothetical protein
VCRCVPCDLTGVLCLQDGDTALIMGAQEGHVPVVEALVGHGANIEAANKVSLWDVGCVVGLRWGMVLRRCTVDTWVRCIYHFMLERVV